MADKLMHNPNDDTQNDTFCRIQLLWLIHLATQPNEQPINIQLVVETFGH